VAKKKAAAAPPTAAKIEKALRTGDHAGALALARDLHALTPTADTLATRKKTIVAAADFFAEQNKYVDFNRVMDEAAHLAPGDAAWTAERACLLARGGKLNEALALADDAVRPKVIAHGVDRALRLQARDTLPEDLRAGYDAIVLAFRQHEAGNEDAARAALDPIGLRSPFLEWKVLLRGLLAHASGDDARAADNFARLDSSRVPARLAAALSNSQLATSTLVGGLRAVARELGRDRPMVQAFRAAEAVLPELKSAAPHLVPRLANCLYFALLKQGQPDDLPRYRKHFGDPPHDPTFSNLQAQIGELIGQFEQAHSHWQKFDEWLATAPPGWGGELARRARAVVWVRMGENAEKVDERRRAAATDDWGPPRRKPKPLDPPAVACFRRATELAPDWAVAAHSLFEALIEAKKPADAEAAARDFLTRDPTYLPAVVALAELLQLQGRAGEAADLWLRAVALNPLDRVTRFRSAVAVVTGSPDNAAAILDSQKPLLDEHAPAASVGLRAVIALKAGRADEAAELREKALAVPGLRVATALRLAVDTARAKAKPADKRAADKLLADALAVSPTPMEVTQALAALDSYAFDGVTYRGSKTHAKKLLDLAPQCVAATAPELDFERLCEILVTKREWKVAVKVIDACRRRFPANPLFAVLRAEAALGRNERVWAAEQLLLAARKLAEKATEQRHRDLGERIDDLLKRLGGPLAFLGGFFDDRD
jgi:tetratricopeptide (TPR) repeat protein